MQTPTSLTLLIVDSCVTHILLGDDPDQLVRDLHDRFPKAHLIGADQDFEAYVARVWQALQEIPPDQTMSYAEVARRIGYPKSARAVA